MFGSTATDFGFERHSATIEWGLDSTGFLDFFLDRFGPMVTARQMLGERFGGTGDLRRDLGEVERGRTTVG